MNDIAEEIEVATDPAAPGRPTEANVLLYGKARDRLDTFALPQGHIDVLDAIHETGGAAARTYEEVAKLLGIPVGTVRSRASRARKVISRRLKQEAEA